MLDGRFDGVESVQNRPHVVTIGNFDGVHLGHQYLLRQVVEEAGARDVSSAAVTFDPLPVEVLRPDRAPKRLTTTADRVRLIRSVGIDTVLTLKFDPALSQLEPEAFIQGLMTSLYPTAIVVGNDFNFGRNRMGTVDTLRDLGATYGFETRAIERIGDTDGDFSSTRIRGLIESGEMNFAARFLGRPYSISGTVEIGNGRGREFGFPTANLDVPKTLLTPGDGIFVAMVSIENRLPLLPSMAYVGNRPTFDESRRVLEINILDFDGDLYGQKLTALFVDRVRGDQRFSSVDELIEQMVHDERRSRELVGALPAGWPGDSILTGLGIGEGARLGER